jgi:hypothetical protein
MKSIDQQFLEEAYSKVNENYSAYGTPLRPNYSFSQIEDKWQDWRGDDRFEGLDLEFPDKQSWKGLLKFNGQKIKLDSKGREVWVDGNKLSFDERLNLRKYIVDRYGKSIEELSDSELEDKYLKEVEKSYNIGSDDETIKSLYGEIDRRGGKLKRSAEGKAMLIHKLER